MTLQQIKTAAGASENHQGKSPYAHRRGHVHEEKTALQSLMPRVGENGSASLQAATPSIDSNDAKHAKLSESITPVSAPIAAAPAVISQATLQSHAFPGSDVNSPVPQNASSATLEHLGMFILNDYRCDSG